MSKGLEFPVWATSKLRLWLEDQLISLYQMGSVNASNYFCLNTAQGRQLVKRRLLLQHTDVAGHLD
jgi:hypothetical protein